MNEALNQIMRLGQQGIAWVGQFLQMVWNWSIAHVIAMFRIPFGSLPLWKQIVYVVVIVALAYFLFRIATRLLEAAMRIFSAVVDLFRAIVEEIPDVLIAGVIALVGAWIIANVNLPFLNSIRLPW